MQEQHGGEQCGGDKQDDQTGKGKGGGDLCEGQLSFIKLLTDKYIVLSKLRKPKLVCFQ